MRLPSIALASALTAADCGAGGPARLAAGSAAPAFSLPGTDGRTHTLQEFSGSPVLVVLFTSNTCPAAQLYENRLRALAADYRGRGVAVVAINPGQAAGANPAELRYSDVGDSLDDMKVRAAYRRLDLPYLSDAGSRAATRAFGVTTVPHVFVFDRDRKLRYDGRIDDSPRGDAVRSADARQAIDALLGGRPVAVPRTEPAGCAVTNPAANGSAAGQAADADGTVSVDMADAGVLKKLRGNDTGRLLLINFWATWCAPCAAEFPDLEATWRMYRDRGLAFTTVSVNDPGERDAVLGFLRSHGATHRNLLFATSDVYGLQAAFDPGMPAPVPFTVLLAPGGDVVHQQLGELDVLKLRRAILANLPDDAASGGLQAHWTARPD